MTGRAAQRGAILMEVLVSIALFVGAASFAIAASRSVLTAIDRAHRGALAADLARAKMSELELGLVTVSALRDEGGRIDGVGSIEGPSEYDMDFDAAWPWEVEVTTSRTEFGGLSLVELTVREAPDVVLGELPVSYTLRQLVALDGGPPPRPYEEDDLLDDLPRGDGAVP